MTITKDWLGQTIQHAESRPSYLTITSNDTTTVNAAPFDNRDGQIKAIAGTIKITDATGTSPTVAWSLQGTTDDGVTFVNVKDSGGNDIATSATSVTTASNTTVTLSIDTNAEGVDLFPYQSLRLEPVLGGTAPGITATSSAVAHRRLA